MQHACRGTPWIVVLINMLTYAEASSGLFWCGRDAVIVTFVRRLFPPKFQISIIALFLRFPLHGAYYDEIICLLVLAGTRNQGLLPTSGRVRVVHFEQEATTYRPPRTTSLSTFIYTTTTCLRSMCW